jgi:hypothetical protein
MKNGGKSRKDMAREGMKGRGEGEGRKRQNITRNTLT